MSYQIQQVNTFLDAEAPSVSVNLSLPPNATWVEVQALLSRIGGVLEPVGHDPLRAAAGPTTHTTPALATEVVDTPPRKPKNKPKPEPEPVEAETDDDDDEPVAPPPKGKKIPLTDEMRAMKFRDLITHLITVSGIKSKRALVKWCTANVDEALCLGKIAAKGDMADRINSTAEFVDPDMED